MKTGNRSKSANAGNKPHLAQAHSPGMKSPDVAADVYRRLGSTAVAPPKYSPARLTQTKRSTAKST